MRLSRPSPTSASASRRRTPPTIIAKVNGDVTSVLNAPDFRERSLSQAAEISPSTPDELAVLMRAEIAKSGKVVKAAGIRID